MQLRHNYRLYPTPSQQQALAQTFGCARMVWNDALRIREQAHEAGLPFPRDGELSKRVITQAKKTPERAWLAEAAAVVLQQSLADLSTAYRRFFDWIKAAKAAKAEGRKPPKRVGSPRFKKRKAAQSIRFTANARFKVLDSGRLRLPKIGDVKVRWSRPLPSVPSSVTVMLDSAGRYWASFVVQTTDEPLSEADSEVGIDLGLTHFAVMSDGTKVAAPKFLRCAAKKIRRKARELSRKKKGSTNRAKAKVALARAHAKVRDTRNDWLHKLSTRVVRDNQAIYVEDLCIAGLSRTRLAKPVHDASWGGFVRMLEYKAARYGRTFGKVDRWFPSTRMCSQCAAVGPKLDLKVRSWTCPCGATHDRDVNAAKNVLAAGRADSNDRGAHVRPAMPAAGVEAVIHPDAACSTRSVEGISVL